MTLTLTQSRTADDVHELANLFAIQPLDSTWTDQLTAAQTVLTSRTVQLGEHVPAGKQSGDAPQEESRKHSKLTKIENPKGIFGHANKAFSRPHISHYRGGYPCYAESSWGPYIVSYPSCWLCPNLSLIGDLPWRGERVGPEHDDKAERDQAQPQRHEMTRVSGQDGAVFCQCDGVVHCRRVHDIAQRGRTIQAK